MAPPKANIEDEKIWTQENRVVTPDEIEALRAH
jgi:hypothetical protein